MEAAENRNISAMLEAGADVHPPNWNEVIPSMPAAYRRDYSMFDPLLQRGARLNVPT
jgi:hypothetical protein